MYCKTLAKAKIYFWVLVLVSLNLICSITTKAQLQFTFTKLAVTQQEPSRRFGSEAPFQPSLRYMPTATNTPSRRFGAQQVGEASLEVLRHRAVKIAPGPEELVAKADKLVDNNQIEKAIELYRNIISSNPKTISAQFGLANALLEVGDYDSALTELTKALVIIPDNSEGQINLGVVLYRSGDISKSINHYEKLLAHVKEKDYLASVNYNLAVAYAHSGDFKKAITNYQKAIEQRKDYPQAYNNLGLIYEVLASINFQQAAQNIELAKKNFLTAIEQRRGQYPLARYNLARLYANEQKYQEATNEFLIVVKQKPDFAEAYLDLGNAYLLKTVLTFQDQVPQAINSFQKALEIRNDNYPLAHENLAIALSIQGKPQEAYPHYRKAINQYKEPSLQTLYNMISTVQGKRGFLIGNELSRSEDVSNLRRQRDTQKLIEQVLVVLEKYEDLDDELKNNLVLRYCAGHAYVSVGNWSEAVEEFAIAWELSKQTDKDSLNSLKAVLELIKYY